MAASIGPWIETTIVLISMLIFAGLLRCFSFLAVEKNYFFTSVGVTTAAGGIGGILATGFAFSLPTFFFIMPETFNTWLAQPFYFSAIFTGLALSAGGFGLVMAHIFETHFLEEENLSFPIGELIYRTISIPNQIHKAMELAYGFIGTQLLLLGQKLLSIKIH